MKSIKEKAEEYTSDIINPVTNCAAFLAYKTGANYVLGEIENFMKDLELGNSTEEKFYKLDIIADIHGFIEQLKSNQ